MIAASLEDPLIVDELLMSGDIVNSTNEFGETPLHIASKNNNQSILDVIINQCSEFAPQDINGNTPLHVACMEGIYENAVCISQRMAPNDFLIKNKDGLTFGIYLIGLLRFVNLKI